MPVITVGDTKILTTKLDGGLTFGKLYIEAYHLAGLLEYSQQHAVRKQVTSDWLDDFEEDVDYRLVHDEDVLQAYESLHREFIGAIRAIKPKRGRMFLTLSGLKKVFKHTSKECDWLEEAVAPYFPAPETPARAEEHVDETKGAGSELDQVAALERQRQYNILETLLDHLKHITDPGLRKLALLNAELGVGRKLDDVRELVLEDGAPVPARDRLPAPEPANSKAAQDYVASRPITQVQGPLFGHRPGVYYGLKQIGEKAGGYSAVQAGKAADLEAERRGHSHDDIRTTKLPFNDLPELPDNTSGKLRKMYRFDTEFSNRVITELRTNASFEPVGPKDITAFDEGGDELPNLSRGPFD